MAESAEVEDELFPATRWSLIVRAKSGNSEDAHLAVDELCNAYWFPLYCYIRGQGESPEHSEDIVQGFFLHVLEKNLFSMVNVAGEEGATDSGKPTRLRSFLLICIKNFRRQIYRRNNAEIRGGRAYVFSIDREDGERRHLQIASSNLDPEQAYDRSWALELIDRARKTMREKYDSRGQADYFDSLLPLLPRDSHRTALGTVAESLGIKDNKLRTDLTRLRKRLKEEIRSEVERTVDLHGGETTVEDEMNYLMSVVG